MGRPQPLPEETPSVEESTEEEVLNNEFTPEEKTAMGEFCDKNIASFEALKNSSTPKEAAEKYNEAMLEFEKMEGNEHAESAMTKVGLYAAQIEAERFEKEATSFMSDDAKD